MTFQMISDVERQMAGFALQEFEEEKYDMCLKTLKYLQSSRSQDTKVFHNICVTEYCLSDYRKTSEFYKNMINVCKQAHLDVHDIESIDDVDHCVVFYNRAVVLYHLSQHYAAISVLDKVFQFIEPLDENLAYKICFLLLELYLCTYQTKEALGLIGYIEAMLFAGSKPAQNAKSCDKEIAEEKNCSLIDTVKLSLVLCKARCFAMVKTAKACKREVKSLMSSKSPYHVIAALSIKCQLEYQRGNYRKAIKILNSPEWPESFENFFFKTGDCLQAVYYNNMGCVHCYMGKPHLGLHYQKRALLEFEEELKKVTDESSEWPSVRPLYMMSIATRHKLLYNMGMQYFYCKEYNQAFACLLEVAEVFFNNPRLWLRLAECCIQIQKLSTSETKQHFYYIGIGQYRKLILKTPSEEVFFRSNVEQEGINAPSLEFAMQALKNALKLLPNDSFSKNDKQTSSCSDSKNNVHVQENSYLQAPPTNVIQSLEIQNLRNAVLLASSYVSLCLGDLILACDYAEQLLSQEKISGAHRFLAHMYAGESLVLLDKINEAMEHLNPQLIMDVSLKFPPSVEDSSGKQQSKNNTTTDTAVAHENSRRSLVFKQDWLPNNLSSAKIIAYYNLAAAYAIREEWGKATACLLEIKNHGEIPSEAISLMIYVQLCQGAVEVAKSYIKQCFPMCR